MLITGEDINVIEKETNNSSKFKRKHRSKKRFRKIINKQKKKNLKIRKNRRKLERRKKRSIKNNKDYKSHNFFDFINGTKFMKGKLKKVNYDNDRALIVIPKNFSLIDNPDETIEVYKQLYSVALNKQSRGIYFDHTNCENLEIGASTVMDVFVMNIEQYKKRTQKISLDFKGQIPKNPKVGIPLYVSGLLNHLNIKPAITKKLADSSAIKRLPLIKGGRNTSTLGVSNIKSGEVATKVADYLEECLGTQGYGLTGEANGYLTELVGETIDNCINHSGDFNQWFTLGYYENESHGELRLVIFNFGQTIYEGLKKHIASEELKKSLERITRIHVKKLHFNKHWDEEMLWTLYALQDGISRLRDNNRPDRGSGTVKLIEAFQSIGNKLDGEKGTMSIVSGNVCIYFDGKYRLSEKLINGESRQVIAFNDKNDLEIPPDRNNVLKMDNYFPGTVISMKFYLDQKFFEKIAKEDYHGG